MIWYDMIWRGMDFLFAFFKVFADELNYKNISKIEMDVLRNDEIIGFSNYFFKHSGDTMIVENYTKFNVEQFGVKVFSINSKAKEIYKKNNLLLFESSTLQNDKKKFVKLIYDKNKNKFIINGSSYVGEATKENIIGPKNALTKPPRKTSAYIPIKIFLDE